LAWTANLTSKFCVWSKTTIAASFKERCFLAKKAFSEEKLLNECFLEISDSFFQDFRKKSEIIRAIEELQLSRKTIMSLDKMSEDALTLQ